MHLNNNTVAMLPYDKCTGCFACYNACPNNAIKMKLSPYGFYRPEIVTSRCNNCGLCSIKCPTLGNTSASPINRTEANILSYAAWSKNNALRKNSSSGGIFTEIANTILDWSGIVYGVRWKSDWTLCHAKAESKQELLPFQGSKYLQSNIGLTYKEISQMVRNGRTVLFSGLPCQVAALHKFVDSENLITIDLVCHGTPSIIVFHRYLEYVSNSRTAKSINFRNKENGWSKFRISIDFTDGSSYSDTFRQDPFLVGFLSDLYLNDACYSCSFCSMPRQGDLTLADYWGVPKEYKNDLGVSLILSNNEKGDKILDTLKDKGNVELIQIPSESTLKGNPRIVNGKLQIPKQRESFLFQIQRTDFQNLQHIISEVNCFQIKK
ncbi:MAG TPA: Coenzyme F420 hydrogenase/dehydrogenase, beta subunit C-terminal domain [Clostridia bacterium]|nr:Coenzyme F420 hydrogenase/dehydrogenase, beta subunit C-terminal domain [Clostridia bacterium]